jgi:hypothetical protein
LARAWERERAERQTLGLLEPVAPGREGLRGLERAVPAVPERAAVS